MIDKNILQLVKRAKVGDKDSFSDLIRLYQDDLHRIAKSKVFNEDDCIDIIQDTILDAYLEISKLKDDKKFKSWLFTILINNCKDYYGKIKNTIPYDEAILDKNSYVMEFNSSEELLNDLDFEEQIIIKMFYLEKYTSKEISEILNVNMNTVKTKLFRARQKLKDKLKEKDIDG